MAKKYKGKDLSLEVGGQEINLEATSVVLQPEDGEDEALTFAEMRDGNTSAWFFEITAVSDYGPLSFWRWCWDNNGEEANYSFAPAGQTKEKFTGQVTVPTPPQIGGTANEVFTFEIRMDCTDRPELVEAAPA